MAKTINPADADFSRVGGGRTKATWFDQEWLNGEVWVLEPEVDYQGKAETARTRLYAEANAIQKGARVKLMGDGNVLFQAFDKSPEQIAAQEAASEKRSATRLANLANPDKQAAKAAKKAQKDEVF